mmetsp:Transcript_31518/g.101201  ORF Transcript_31518/g.101201 Transcript_31518/m.101201 type:complete len:346 (-) Transcript_31518:329-1366(-)
MGRDDYAQGRTLLDGDGPRLGADPATGRTEDPPGPRLLARRHPPPRGRRRRRQSRSSLEAAAEEEGEEDHHDHHDHAEEEESDEDEEDDGGSSSFAVVGCDPPPDHHFATSAEQKVPLKVTRKLWNQLNKNLPAGVAVRAFEKRSDLLRVVIVGPEDTPYRGLLFVFDVQLTADYPNEPPSVYYHARGVKERLNPNLYENGKVCLSLLGTWSGPGWDPGHSTVLQILVSIQGLVLVDRPYYNEPGNEKHERTVEGEHLAHLYNESATLLAVRTTISVLKQPPKPLASFFRAHLLSDAFKSLITHLADQLQGGDDHRDDDDQDQDGGDPRLMMKQHTHKKKTSPPH